MNAEEFLRESYLDTLEEEKDFIERFRKDVKHIEDEEVVKDALFMFYKLKKA